MTATVTVLHPCGRCGGESNPFDLYLNDELQATTRACQACIDKTLAELAKVRPVFDAMLACGIDRESANELMALVLEKAFP